ncbi:hypothetical protein SAMN05428944_2160 [Streptomyces sp. 1222.5]|nr:hypothetical protein BX260_5934 [Streptomyces sp. 5112.2]SEC00597.1 hypothetical protein SAMN05428944_2160 [Streptomyces sp. 1222.5]
MFRTLAAGERGTWKNVIAAHGLFTHGIGAGPLVSLLAWSVRGGDAGNGSYEHRTSYRLTCHCVNGGTHKVIHARARRQAVHTLVEHACCVISDPDAEPGRYTLPDGPTN